MTARTLLALLGALGVAVLAVVLLSGSDDRYEAHIVLRDAGGLRKGANVRLDGAPVGRVTGLKLDHDHALATVRLEHQVAPLGAGASVLIQADGIFGERYVELRRGDVSRPLPDGTTIPMARAAVSTRLDDVIDTLDTDTRGALQQFLNEQGTLIVGRGRDLAGVLAALPSGLGQTRQLLDQLSTDNAALGRLVDESDRVVGAVAQQRGQFGRMVSAASGALGALDTRRAQLGQTLHEAPSTLRSTQRVLAALQEAAAPLAPAARGLQRTSPTLAATLRQLPSFAKAAAPAFAVARKVSPDLRRLGTGATPTVRQLVPLAQELSTYTTDGLDPFTKLLDDVSPDLFGVMEGWARSTQGYDGSSRIFRFGATSGTDTFAPLLQAISARADARKRAGRRPGHATAPAVPALPKLPKLPATPDPQRLLGGITQQLPKAIDDLGRGKPVDAVKDALGGSSADGSGRDDHSVLDLLLK